MRTPGVPENVREHNQRMRELFEPLGRVDMEITPAARKQHELLDPDVVRAFSVLTADDWDRVMAVPVEGTMRLRGPDGILLEFFECPANGEHATRCKVGDHTVATRMRRTILFGDFSDGLVLWKKNPLLHVGEHVRKYPWYPYRASSVPAPSDMYQMLAYRIAYLRNIEKDNLLPKEIRYAAVMWNNAHIPFAIYMMRRGATGCSDSVMVAPCTDLGDRAPYDVYKPSVDTIFHEGELPDLTSLLMEEPFWNERHTVEPHPEVQVLRKAMPLRCSIRCLASILRKQCSLNTPVGTDMYNTILAMIAISYMGYATSNYWPHIYIRIVTFRQLLVERPSKESVIAWMGTDVQQLLFYVIKEFLRYGVVSCPPLQESMGSQYKWTRYAENITRCMDDVRTSFDPCRLFSVFGSDYGPIREFLTAQTKAVQQEGPFYHRRRCPAEFAVAECNVINDTKFNGLLDPPDKDCWDRKDLDLLRELIERGDPSDPPDVEHVLVAVGIDASVAAAQQAAVTVLERTGGNNALKASLHGLANTDLKSFQLVRTYWEYFQSHVNIQTYPLPEHWYRKQVAALHRRLELDDCEPLPPRSAIYYVCRNCKTFAGPVVGRDENDPNASGHGNTRVAVDPATMFVYCARKNDRSSVKRRGQNNILPADAAKRQKSAAKEARKHRVKQQCSSERVLEIDMLGSVLRVYDHYYVLCVGCASPTTYSEQAFYGTAILCGPCFQRARQAIAHLSRPSCVYCSVDWNKQPTRKRARFMGTWKSVRVYDDCTHTTNHIIRDVWFCEKHHQPWIHAQGKTWLLSDIFRGISEGWKTSYVNDIPLPRVPQTPAGKAQTKKRGPKYKTIQKRNGPENQHALDTSIRSCDMDWLDNILDDI